MKPEITSIITLKIGDTTLSLTPDEAREVHRQLGNLLPPEKSSGMSDAQEMLKALRKAAQDKSDRDLYDQQLTKVFPVNPVPATPVNPWHPNPVVPAAPQFWCMGGVPV